MYKLLDRKVSKKYQDQYQSKRKVTNTKWRTVWLNDAVLLFSLKQFPPQTIARALYWLRATSLFIKN